MFALVISLVSVLVQARSFVIPIAPKFLPKRFSADDLENAWLGPDGKVHYVTNGKLGCAPRARAEDVSNFNPPPIPFPVPPPVEHIPFPMPPPVEHIPFPVPPPIEHIPFATPSVSGARFHISDADELDNSYSINTVGASGFGPSSIGSYSLGSHFSADESDADQLENLKIHNLFHGKGRLGRRSAMSSDDLDNGGVNWGEIVKIAGQVNQIGQILGFDGEDVPKESRYLPKGFGTADPSAWKIRRPRRWVSFEELKRHNKQHKNL